MKYNYSYNFSDERKLRQCILGLENDIPNIPHQDQFNQLYGVEVNIKVQAQPELQELKTTYKIMLDTKLNRDQVIQLMQSNGYHTKQVRYHGKRRYIWTK